MNRSTPGLPVHHQLPESTQTRVHWVGDAIQPFHPLSSPSPPAFSLSQHQGLILWPHPRCKHRGEQGSCSSYSFVSWVLKTVTSIQIGFSGGSVVKSQSANVGSIPGLKRCLGGEKWELTPIFLPGKSHRQRSLAGYSPWGCKRIRCDSAPQQHKPFNTYSIILVERMEIENYLRE